MWSSLLLAGFLGGWWGVLALSPAPPSTAPAAADASKRTTLPMNYADEYYYGEAMILGAEPPSRGDALRYRERGYHLGDGDAGAERTAAEPQLRSRQLEIRRQMEIFRMANEKSGKAMRRDNEEDETARTNGDRGENSSISGETGEPILVSWERKPPADDERSDNFVRTGGHYANDTSPESGLGAIDDPRRIVALNDGSAIERPRIVRSPKQQQQQQQQLQQQRPRNRTRTESPREQRRRCRNRNCRGKNWCPDMDVGNRAFLAPTVFEGKARSMSSLRKPGFNYAVTFEVRQVYKSQPGFLPLQKNDSVRLHFRDKTAPGKSTICGYDGGGNKEAVGPTAGGSQRSHQQQQQQQKERDNLSAGVVRANIKRGKVYLVFVNRVGPRNFTILGEPVIRSKKNEQAVQAVIRPDYVREVTLSELRDSVARYRDRVKLVCRTRGSPPPRVHWLKDGVPLQPRRGLRIQHKRRRSKVVISSARPEDSGRYECIAESTSGHRASLAAQLLVAHDTRIPETTTAAWLRQEQPCPIAGDFCMNGGTCLFFETVGEPACRCAEGFTGLRCETKDVISTGSVYNRHRAPFSCKLGLSTSYYC